MRCFQVILTFLALLLSPVLAARTQYPGKAWKVRTPDAAGVDARLLEQFAKVMGGDGCIIKDGYLIKSWGDISSRMDWASAAKGVLSTMLLLAVQEGKLESIDAPVRSLGWPLSHKDSEMTFRHLANMTSGYSRAEAPGAAWAYNDFGIQLLALSLEKIFQQPLDAACRQRLARLGFEDGAIFGSRHGLGVDASVRDFARIGWLWLNRGQWKGRTLLRRDLFAEHFRPGVPANLPRSAKAGHDYLGIKSYGGSGDQVRHGPGVYGLNFWFNELLKDGQRVWPAAPPDTFQANGAWNRDTVTMFPSLGMVVAVRGAHSSDFQPGKAKSKYNKTLQMLMDAVGKGGNASKSKKAGTGPASPLAKH